MPGCVARTQQQPELLRGEIDVLALDAHAPARRIDVQAMNLERALAGGRGLGLQLRSPRPPQQRARAGHQLANAERLGEVIVGAAFEAEHLVALFATRRQHQDRHILVRALAPHRAADRNAIDARQHQVENDQIEGLGTGADERLLAVGHRLDLEALEAEVELDQLANVRFVFDDQNA